MIGRVNLKVRSTLLFLATAFLISAQSASADPNLVSWWEFDEGTGTTAYDSAGSNDGVLTGNAGWVAGKIGSFALDFDGNEDYVNVASSSFDLPTHTTSFWMKPDILDNMKIIEAVRGTTRAFGYIGLTSDGRIAHFVRSGTESVTNKIIAYTDSNTVNAGVWYHAVSIMGSEGNKIYVNGIEQTLSYSKGSQSSTESWAVIDNGNGPDNLNIGSFIYDDAGHDFFDGTIDDVRIYNKALSAEEIWQLYKEGIIKAFTPNPNNGAIGVALNTALSWSPGKYAASHDVYLGVDYNDVNDADVGSPEYMGNFDVNSYDPCGLDPMTTYYWRVDEVNEPNLWKGDVWSFETAGPVIELSATEFVFYADEGGTNPANQILGISNTGHGTLNWKIIHECSWLSVEPNSGSSTGEVDNVTLSVDISGLIGGNYSCILTISDSNAANSPQSVWVFSLVTGPVIELSSTQFQFMAIEDGANPADQILGISNSGVGTLNWEISEDCQWLSVEPNNGSSTGEVNYVNLNVDISSLAVGVYNYELMISDPNFSVKNNPQIVSINLIVTGLVSYWKLDEGIGTIAYDSAGSNNGTITGATWTSGRIGGALSFDGSGDYVLVGDKNELEQQEFTLSFWARLDNPSDSLQGGIAKGYIFGSATQYSYTLDFSDGNARAGITNTSDTAFTITCPIGDPNWHMWSMTVGGGTLTLSKDGAFADSASYAGTIDYGKSYNDFVIGARDNGNYTFDGKIDDVRFYSRALSAEEIGQLYQEVIVKAFAPNPADGATDADQNTVLIWSSGKYAASHDVYFGADFYDVNDADTLSPEYMGNFDVNSFDPCGLDLLETYYWRIDEVNEPNLWKGNVWSFKTGQIIYVDSTATGDNNGANWANAYKYLQDALIPVKSGTDILVAQGTYRPDRDTTHTSGTNNRYATFQLKNGVALYGGFPAGGGIWENRNHSVYPTILSGNIGGNVSNVDNSYHVVTGSGTNSTAILDGFIVTAGNSNGSGAGMYNYSGSPTVTNCTFADNSAKNWGGGMYNYQSNPKITNCTFTGNSVSGNNGGGISNFSSSSPMITNCTFSENSADDFGGGIYNIGSSSPKVTNCIFSKNSAGYYGGGICNLGNSNPIVINCTFAGNSAESGGGMFNTSGSSPTVTNCTFSDNSALYGGGMRNLESSSPTITNCILWGNIATTEPQISISSSSVTVSFSDIQGGWTGTGNIDADPCFVDATNGDLHLRPDSPCINTGDPNFIPEPDETDIDGEPRVMLGRVDMGADEFFSPLEINFVIVNKIRIDRTIFEYDSVVTATNISSSSVTNVQLEVVTASENVTIIDPHVTFGDIEIGPGESVASLDMCTFQIDRSAPAEIIWQTVFDMVDGTQDTTSGIFLLNLSVIPGDFNGDYKVDFEDLAILTNQWLQPPGTPSADIAPPPTGDNFVDFLDYTFLANYWLRGIGG